MRGVAPLERHSVVSDGCDLCSAPRALLVAACLIPFFVLCVITLLVALLLTPCL